MSNNGKSIELFLDIHSNLVPNNWEQFSVTSRPLSTPEEFFAFYNTLAPLSDLPISWGFSVCESGYQPAYDNAYGLFNGASAMRLRHDSSDIRQAEKLAFLVAWLILSGERATYLPGTSLNLVRINRRYTEIWVSQSTPETHDQLEKLIAEKLGIAEYRLSMKSISGQPQVRPIRGRGQGQGQQRGRGGRGGRGQGREQGQARGRGQGQNMFARASAPLVENVEVPSHVLDSLNQLEAAHQPPPRERNDKRGRGTRNFGKIE